MTETQTETLTDDQLVELAKDLIEDHAELKNVKTDDLVKILSTADKKTDFVAAMYRSNYQIIKMEYRDGEWTPINANGDGVTGTVPISKLLREIAVDGITNQLNYNNYEKNGLTDNILYFAVNSFASYDVDWIYNSVKRYSDLIGKHYCDFAYAKIYQYMHFKDHDEFETGLLNDLCKIYDDEMKCDELHMISDDKAKRLLPCDRKIMWDLMYGENAKKDQKGMNKMDAIGAQIERELIERDELLSEVDSNTRAYLLSCEKRDPWYITRIISNRDDILFDQQLRGNN